MELNNRKTLAYIKLLITETMEKRKEIRKHKQEIKKIQDQIQKIHEIIFTEFKKSGMSKYFLQRGLGQDLEYKFVNIYRKFTKEND